MADTEHVPGMCVNVRKLSLIMIIFLRQVGGVIKVLLVQGGGYKYHWLGLYPRKQYTLYVVIGQHEYCCLPLGKIISIFKILNSIIIML